jgi:hypothetical protein
VFGVCEGMTWTGSAKINKRLRGEYLAPPKFSAMVDLIVLTTAAILGGWLCKLLVCA